MLPEPSDTRQAREHYAVLSLERGTLEASLGRTRVGRDGGRMEGGGVSKHHHHNHSVVLVCGW